MNPLVGLFVAVFAVACAGFLVLIALGIPSREDESLTQTMYRIFLCGFAMVTLRIAAMDKERIGGHHLEERIGQYLAEKLLELKFSYADLDREREDCAKGRSLWSEKALRGRIRERLERVRKVQAELDYAYGLALPCWSGIVKEVIVKIE